MASITEIEAALVEKQSKDYTLHLRAVRKYFQKVLKMKMPPAAEFESCLHNGVFLALLACKLSDRSVSEIFDANQLLYSKFGLQYHHIENINMFLEFLREIKLASVFCPDAADIYEAKNLPKLIYCLYALKDHCKLVVDEKKVNAGNIGYRVDDYKENVIPIDDYKFLEFEKFLVASEGTDMSEAYRDEFFKRLCGLAENEKLSIVYEAFPLYIKYLLRARNQKNCCFNLQEILSVIDSTTKQYYRLKFEVQTAAAFKIQYWWKSVYLKLQLRKKIKAVLKLQAAFRGTLTRKILKEFKTNPTFRSVKRFSSVLQYSLVCYKKEQQLQLLRNEIFQQLEYKKSVKSTLEEKDLLIGLLIQNRLTVQQIFLHRKKPLEKTAFETELPKKQINEHSQKLLAKFQNLFHILQINPTYFATLLVHCPKSEKETIQNVFMSFFNYGLTMRDEKLMLKVFQLALPLEIELNFQNLDSLNISNSAVINCILGYCKQGFRVEQLKSAFKQSVVGLGEEKDVIYLLPRDIFNTFCRVYISKSKIKSPKSENEAFSIDWVQTHLRQNLNKIKFHVRNFIEELCSKLEDIPKGIRFIIHLMFKSLENKFKTSTEELLKITGSFLFHRLFSPLISIPAPNYVIDNKDNSVSRKNHALLAKILGYIVLNRGFAENFLQPLNPCIAENHKLLMNFMLELVDTNPIKEQQRSPIYPEIELMSEAQVSISLRALSDLLKTLTACMSLYPESSAKDLQTALIDLPICSTPDALLQSDLFIGLKIRDADQNLRISCIGKNTPVMGDADTSKLFLSIKELCVFLLPFLEGRTLPQALLLPPNIEKSKTFAEHLKTLHESQLEKMRGLTLQQAQRRLKNMLQKLEAKGYVNKEDGYRTVLEGITRDVVLRMKFLEIQKRELEEAEAVKSMICRQVQEMEDKLKLYEEYISACLKNQSARSGEKLEKALKNKKSLKYTARSLLEKGVLLSIADIASGCYEQIVISIVPEETPGLFTLKGKWSNVPVESYQLDIGQLLYLQYEGQETIDVFRNVTLRVTNLIHLINKKFYGSNV